ncbi:uncharacterized protein LOC128990542 isoform X2 [Macrosteles quadrilineatus]|uniref:uncharacterized protein LOC128990542 isoform X2 n=1 Tax=Macrosteles quadrilineatus TaxID=74068 RepID=UPI0023E1CBEA|nr:uncharacterized protein LOC128990542 isoform X2 [Macrosteles quadrilineatus]
MDITETLQNDIVKIQNELITAIQNHQVLVLRQQVSPSENVRKQIEEVQRHIICLGESQKILVSRLRNELKTSQLKVNINKKENNLEKIKISNENDKYSIKQRNSDLNRSLLKKAANRDRSFVTSNASDSDNCDRNNVLPKERQPMVDSSSEENRTPPCQSPVTINGNTEFELRGAKRPASEPYHNSSPGKRPKSTLQVTPRPSSPVPARTKNLDVLSSSSEESSDSLISQQTSEQENKVDFALALGLITKETFNKIIKKKSERRRRRVNSHHHLYDDLWELTTLQKRSRLKEPEAEGEYSVRDCETPLSDSDLCFVCRKPGELRECQICQTGCHTFCVSNRICPACTHQAPPSPNSVLIEGVT